MERILRILLVTLIGFSLLTAGPLFIGWCEEKTYQESRETVLHFRLVITSDKPLVNKTFFLPLPLNGNVTLPSIEVKGAGSLKGSDCFSGMDLFSDRDAVFLRLIIGEVADITTTSRYGEEYTCTLESVDILGHALDSEDPEKNSYVFKPRNRSHVIECPSDDGPPFPHTCYQYTTPVYVGRGTSDACITIDAIVEGTNRWRVIEQGNNAYRDRILVSLPPEANGWFSAEGVLEAGIGDEDPYYKPVDKNETSPKAPIHELRRILSLEQTIVLF
ncbi:MAG: hypothetical protein QHG99_00460 [Methanomicrobiales archaeon]|nr:hypothetical protein [Methanomicrobiales archaeon]